MEYVQMTLNDWVQMKQRLKQELLGVKQSFVRIGYVLRKIEEQKLYEQDGYKSIAEFAQAEYGLGPSITSRFMSINREYSIDGYSEHLRPEYAELGRSQLEEMLKLPDSDRQMIQPEASREDIRELKRFNKSGPAEGEADDLHQLIEKFYKDNPEILNAVFSEAVMFEEQTVSRFTEIVNPGGNRSYKKGLYFLMMYENRVAVKKFGEKPRDLTWWEFCQITMEIFGESAAGNKTWQKYFKAEEEKPENTEVQGDVVESTKTEAVSEEHEPDNADNLKESDEAKENKLDEIVREEKDEKEEIAPAQKVEKSPKIQSYSQLSDDIPGQTEIEKDFPELLPERREEATEQQNQKVDASEIMPKPTENVENCVDNSEEIQENVINTEAEADSEQVDNSEETEVHVVGSRWEYMKTMEPYKVALYLAVSVKEMAHMRLGSADYWREWLEQEVDVNGEAL